MKRIKVTDDETMQIKPAVHHVKDWGDLGDVDGASSIQDMHPFE